MRSSRTIRARRPFEPSRVRGPALIGAIALAVLLLVPAGAYRPSAPPSAPRPLLIPGSDGKVMAQALSSLETGHGPAATLPVRVAGPHPLSSPGVGQGVSLAYDAADGYVLALAPNITGSGNTTGLGNVSETWTFSGGNWTQMALPAGPPNRGYSAMVYDPVDRYVLLFGGVGLGGTYGFLGYLGDTWTYRNGTWTNLTKNLTTSPGPRAYSQVTWDASDGYAVMVGGLGPSGNLTGNLSQTWEFVNGTWTAGPTTAGLQPQGALSYDAADGYVLYFGGAFTSPGAGTSNEDWTFHAGVWTDISGSVTRVPSSRAWAAMTYDPNLGAVLMFGGASQPAGSTWSYLNDTWEYSNLTWTPLSSAAGPGPREQAQMTFDAADNVTILFGGIAYSAGGSATSYSDTWAFGATGNGTVYGPVAAGPAAAWTQAAPRLGSSRTVVDVGSPITFTTWGVQGTASSYNYTGLPPGCVPSDAPTVSCWPTQAGQYSVEVSVVTSAGVASATAFLTVDLPPTIDELTVAPLVTEVGGTVHFAANLSGGTPPLSLSYAGLPPGCGSADSTSLTCNGTVPGTFVVVLNATDATGWAVQRSVSFEVLPDPTIASFSASPATVDVGQSSLLTPHLLGGVAPYSYAYSDLPAGCPTGTGPSVDCTLTTPGAYSFGVTVTDHLGFTGSGSGTVVVNPDPSIQTFAANRTGLPLGGSVSLTVAASGGTGALEYDYLGLPPGCVSENASILSCTPGGAGNFSVVVVVTDGVGVTASAQVAIDVAPPVVIPPGHAGTPGSGSGSSSSTASGGAAGLFYLGVTLGLVALAIGVGSLYWRARLQRQGEELVRELRAQPPNAPSRPSPATEPSTRRGSPPPGPQ